MEIRKLNPPPGWTAVGTRGEYIEFDAEATPLQILTEAVSVGDEGVLFVKFYTEDERGIGGIELNFIDSAQYRIGYCAETFVTFTLPEGDKSMTWTITKTDVSIALACNDQEIFNLQLSDSTNTGCVPQWSQDAAKIMFHSRDTLSRLYRSEPGIIGSGS